MKKTAAREKPGAARSRASTEKNNGKIHPVIIYPFRQPKDYSDLTELYQLVARLEAEKDKYARPITVMDRKTYYSHEGAKAFLDFRSHTVARHSSILDAWCVDTCQMWYSGLGLAFEQGQPGDVYWLIPGDFNYGTPMGKDVLSRLHDLPEIALELDQDLCIGEIATDAADSKLLIDTYGTFALLYTWFPAEAQEIRQVTERPRSEFLAFRHRFLREALKQRWYAYEQTVIILLQAVFGKNCISRFLVGNISDLPEDRESLASALQQLERTERALNSFWLECYQGKTGWLHEYRRLEKESEQVRRAAMIVLQNVLGPHPPGPRLQGFPTSARA